MDNLYDAKVIKSLLARHGFSFSKSLGQNFIIDSSVCPRIVEGSEIDENTGVIEIGAGIGVLTAELAKVAKKVVSIELDTRLLPILSETLDGFDNVEVVNDDILKVDLHKLIKEKFGDMRVCVCANLPYYITSPVIMLLLENNLPIDSITVMVQKEAADRLCAQIGSRESGAVTVAVNYYATAQKLFNVSRGCFMPSPNVDSSVIRLDIRSAPAISVNDEKKFFKVVKSAFGQRRKTAVNAISAGMAIPKSDVIDAFNRANIDTNIRAERISMEDFAKICKEI